MSHSLVIRADASSAIGVGHAMRCLALAQAWQDSDGAVAWFARELPDALIARLRREGVALHLASGLVGDECDAAELVQIAEQARADWVVVDGYRFGPDYLRQARCTGKRLLLIDDMAHLESYPVEVLLNQNMGAAAELYAGKLDDATKLLLGVRHSLLRREFRGATASRSPRANRPLHVLVSFGGSDPANITRKVIDRLAAGRPANLHVVVIAGAANLHVDSLRRAAAIASFRCELHFAVENLAPLMAWADVAVSAAGSTVWELAAMQLPALIGASEENQLAVMRGLSGIPIFRAATAAELLGWDLLAEFEALLLRCADREHLRFDALGAARVVDFLCEEAATVPATR